MGYTCEFYKVSTLKITKERREVSNIWCLLALQGLTQKKKKKRTEQVEPNILLGGTKSLKLDGLYS